MDSVYLCRQVLLKQDERGMLDSVATIATYTLTAPLHWRKLDYAIPGATSECTIDTTLANAFYATEISFDPITGDTAHMHFYYYRLKSIGHN